MPTFASMQKADTHVSVVPDYVKTDLVAAANWAHEMLTEFGDGKIKLSIVDGKFVGTITSARNQITVTGTAKASAPLAIVRAVAEYIAETN